MTPTTLTGQGVCGGAARGEALVSPVDLSLSLIDPATGVVTQPTHPLRGISVAGRVLIFPNGSGSSSGSYRLLHLAELGTAPAAIVNTQANAVVIAGAVLAGIPLLHKVAPDPLLAIKTGDHVLVDADNGLLVVNRCSDV